MSMLEIRNVDDNRFVSEILEVVAKTAERETGVASKLVVEPIEGEKGSLVVDVFVGMSVAAAWDAIKYVAVRARVRSQGSEDAEIAVGDEVRSVFDLLEPPADADSDEVG
ncbi:MAG: hypothetical protein GY929_01335 [Actinomycetia bacterium]|nr:hypothetical protein [Actinomycetes bacterium]